MPAMFELIEGKGLPEPGAELVDYGGTVEGLSVAVGVVLIATYVAGLIFSLRTHSDLFNVAEEGDEEPEFGWSVRRSDHDAGDRRARGRPDVGDPRRLDHRGVGGDRAQRVLHRRHRRRDRRQRRRALGRGADGVQEQDEPRGQHRDRLERAGGAVRRAGAGLRLVRDRAGADGARLQRLRAGGDPARGPGRQPGHPGGRVDLVRGRPAAGALRDPRRSRSSTPRRAGQARERPIG